MYREKIDRFCNLEAGYVWTEQDCLDIIQFRSDILFDLLTIAKSLETIELLLKRAND